MLAPKITHLLLLLLLLFLISCFQLRISAATNAIMRGQLMDSSQTIVSPNGTFELAFFSLEVDQVPEGSTNNKYSNFYLGIRYKQFPDQTAVWIANRDRPIRRINNSNSNNSSSSASCFLTINSNGNLVIFGGEKSGLSIPLSSISLVKNNTNTCAMLLDTGNFVLRNNCYSSNDEDNLLWQSFDYPSDTLVPGMKIGYNLKSTGKTWQFKSRRSLQDPSPGRYTAMVDPAKPSEIVVMDGSQKLYTTGPWIDQFFSYVPEMKADVTASFKYISNVNESYFLFIILTKSIITRYVMDVSGKLRQYVWHESGQNWVLVWEEPKDLCDVYKYCGAYSICDRNHSPYCNCLQGFQPSNQKGWSFRNWSSGCARVTSLQCGDQDGFLLMPNMSLPLEPKSLQIESAEACKLYCLQICNCSAYAYKNNNHYCSIWFDSLYNLRKAEFGEGDDLFLRLAASELKILEGHSRNRTRSLVLGLSISFLAVIILSAIGCCLWRRKLKQRGKEDINQDLLSFDFSNKTKSTISELSNISGGTWDVELPFFSFASVSDATNNFSDANKLGEGGFGPVYKGTLLSGHEVAIKRLSTGSCQGLEELKNETTLIAKLQHRNLVRLLGCCIDGEEKILIYEYMANKSLDLILFDPNNQVKLTWDRRVNIIEGIAQGLLYLHQYSRLRIIHRDLKASNILLDDEMNPKISDFGMAKIFGDYKTEANTNRIMGTYGYMSPEYAMGGLFSIKSDMFSFGVLLLEILSGKRNSNFHLSNDKSLNLIGHAWNLWVSGRPLELIDPILLSVSSSLSSSPIRYIHVALLCVQEQPIDRPTMSQVIAIINSEFISLPPLKQPAFSFHNVEESSSSSKQACSINDLTLSLHAR